MDDRKKQIDELEQRKREQTVLLDTLLIRLGETLLNRASNDLQLVPSEQDAVVFGELTSFRQLKNNIADSEASIQAVEEQIRRFRELEENIESKEQEDAACTKELTIMYGKLGKLLLEVSMSKDHAASAGNGTDFCAPYRDSAEALLTKVLSLEERLAGLEERESGNVFSWIGKGAQGLVLRSFLTKAQENLEQLHRNVGERYSQRDSAHNDHSLPETAETKNICVMIEQKQTESQTLSQGLAALKEEKRAISGSFNAEGGPLKRIQILKNHIAHVRDELKVLYRSIGTEAASINGAECREIVGSIILPEDKEMLDNAVRSSQMMHNNETAIQKLQASLDIDDENVKIEKFRKMIQEKREKIAQAEKSIMKIEENIRISESSIEKLQKLL